MQPTEIFSLLSSMASLVLSILAIALSIIFYKMSSTSSSEISTQASNIKSAVDKLEMLFDRLYSDTFSMMKDTVTDMRKQLWSNPANNVDEKNSIQKEEIERIVRNSLGKEGEGNHNIDKIVREMEKKLNSIAFHTKDSKRETFVLDAIKKLSPISFEGLVAKMATKESSIVGDVFELRNKGLITWDGPDKELGRDNIISIIDNEGKHPEKE